MKKNKKHSFIKWYFSKAIRQAYYLMFVFVPLTIILILVHLYFDNYYSYNFEQEIITRSHGLLEYEYNDEYLKLYEKTEVLKKYDKTISGGYMGMKKVIYSLDMDQTVYVIYYDDLTPLVKVFSIQALFDGVSTFWVHKNSLHKEYPINEKMMYFDSNGELKKIRSF